MEGQYIRGPRQRVGVYEGGSNAQDGSASFINQIVGFLNGAGPYGAAIVGAFNAVANLFGGGPSEWDGAGPGVHEWFTAHGEEELKNFCRDHHPEAFGSVDNAKAMRMLWMFQGAPARNGSFLISTKGAIWGLDEPRYMLSSVQRAAEFWATVGVDLPRSIENRLPASLVWIPSDQIVPIPGFIAGLDEEIDSTIDAIDSGEELTDEQLEIAAGLEEESEAQGRKDALAVVGVVASMAALVKS
jgi:hypothetical protein